MHLSVPTLHRNKVKDSFHLARNPNDNPRPPMGMGISTIRIKQTLNELICLKDLFLWRKRPGQP